MAVANLRRRLFAGLELQSDTDAHVRVWAPACHAVDVVLARPGGRQAVAPLEREPDGFFSGNVSGASPGDRYWFRLDGERLRPDPMSRYQPEGPHGPSEIVDPSAFQWTDEEWPGVARSGHVIYEMHVGTFTREGTWAAAAAELAELAALGITVIEIMPIADFAGQRGWGYDGVNLYAPTRLYGAPDDLRRFVDRAHAAGIGVILDVVYNHFGPDGNYLAEFSPGYFTDRYENDWGAAINFEGGPPAVREFFIANAAYWIDEFHFDGLRLDATQDMHDSWDNHVLGAIVRRARAAAGSRSVYVIAENEGQNTRLVRRLGIDGLWNDDFHHAAVVALTGRREAYYTDYRGSAQELVSCAKYGYLYQGQWYRWQRKYRGTPALDLAPSTFIAYLENHDQVANSAFGRRLHQKTSAARHRALTAFLLLGPATPLIFQGQEFSASAPFLYFVDHRPELQASIVSGRREFLAQFPHLTDPTVVGTLPDPLARETFERCRLDLTERQRNAAAYALHRDLIALRHGDPVIAGAGARRVDGALISSQAFVVRYFGGGAGDRLLVVNLGCDLDLSPAPEPLVAPPAGAAWTVQWSSEAVRYGGEGTPPFKMDAGCRIAGESALLLRSESVPADGHDHW